MKMRLEVGRWKVTILDATLEVPLYREFETDELKRLYRRGNELYVEYKAGGEEQVYEGEDAAESIKRFGRVMKVLRGEAEVAKTAEMEKAVEGMRECLDELWKQRDRKSAQVSRDDKR